MPTTKQSGNNSRENENDRKMGSQNSSSQSGNDRNKENRSMGTNTRQSGNTSKSHR